MELYVLCIGIIQRILCYQKKCRIRVNYVWKDLWTALISLLRFILQNENYLGKKMNIFELCIKIVNILNFFITYGDNFLPTPGSYDELYYEIIRMHQIFDNVYSMGKLLFLLLIKLLAAFLNCFTTSDYGAYDLHKKNGSDIPTDTFIFFVLFYSFYKQF